MSLMSNKALLDKCREFILSDPVSGSMDQLIKDALITANREIFTLDGMTPLAWARESYDELFTRYYADISAITKANPGVITADSVDNDLTSDHGFQTNDIVWLDGIDGMKRLNRRFYLATRASATTLTLQQLDAVNAINTISYETYDGGGKVCHAGFVLPSTIEPTVTQEPTADYRWKIKRVWDVTFDGYPATPVSEEWARERSLQNISFGRPVNWRYRQYYRGGPATPTHALFWYGVAGQKHNVTVHIEKEYPDLATWTNSIYPPHPADVHDFIWHRALANLATNTERQRRESKEGRLMGKIEILYYQMWTEKKIADERSILSLSRSMLGERPNYGGMRA
jgi:hypothetical protein